MIKILVSACLMGEKVRFDGAHKRIDHPQFQKWQSENRLVLVCPEVIGGLSVPRPPAEIVGEGAGRGVLDGKAKVFTKQGEDVSEAFVRGAQRSLELAIEHQVGLAILKARSPSCGNIEVYDGTHSGTRISGSGTAAAALQAKGIRVFNEAQIDEAAAYLSTLTAVE